ncbi:MAG: COX15/CtaA family protein [Gemmataceae bacterium]
MTDTASPPVPRWLRAWAGRTVVAALPLALLGAETTTRGVGMADQVSVRAPWYFFTLNLQETPLGLLIEHGHRLFGWAVGLCAIVLAVGAQLCVRDWRRRLGWLALVLVSAQGVLGILRVRWNALAGPELAAVHGCFAQLAFATLVAVAVLFSKSWEAAAPAGSPRKLAALLAVLIYVQIVFGAFVRHKLDPVAQRLHVVLAFAVVGLAFSLYTRLRLGNDPMVKVGRWLHMLVLVQAVFGVEAWMRRFGAGVLPELVTPTWGLDLTRSAHHLLGTVIFSTSVALAVLLCRPGPAPVVTLPRPLEGAA